MAAHSGVTLRSAHSFSKADRVRKRAEYLSIYRSAGPMHTSQFVFYALKKEGSGRRMGCTVSKKIGNAVVRNRVKRFIREVFRLDRELFPEGSVLVVNAKKKAALAGFHDVREAFGKIAQRLAEEDEGR